ncbi:alpha/beta fold hydrolase [Kitasatospora griseola]|uniref:alpha/beta fold hydrolase n=1 Tax=Kitasatospora griseola TaxID=2064 RepID=UPI001670FFC1|nr:alpha/beta hydrolase [Kitasatospora griseola]GGQ78323.1 hypothetical protein GCM10010195_37490 [Kitasatospora griseola]
MTENANTTSHKAAWSGSVPVEDTALAVTDTGGPGQPVVYLNGSYATQRNWRHVIAELGDGYRHITFDERARGRSGQSADYSFAACLRDIDAVLDATGVRRPLLVGWSYGAALALHRSTRNPDRTAGAVMVDGGYPWDYLATGAGLGGTEEGLTAMRATLDPILARNPHVQVSATVPSKHTTVVRKDFRAIATAVREVCEVREVRAGGVCQEVAQ